MAIIKITVPICYPKIQGPGGEYNYSQIYENQKIVDDFDKKVPLIEIANLLEEYKNGSTKSR